MKVINVVLDDRKYLIQLRDQGAVIIYELVKDDFGTEYARVSNIRSEYTVLLLNKALHQEVGN